MYQSCTKQPPKEDSLSIWLVPNVYFIQRFYYIRESLDTACTHSESLQPYRFHHFHVVEVVDDVFEDVSVRHEPQRSEDNHDRDLLSDIRQGGHYPPANGALLGTHTPAGQLAHPQRADRARRVLNVGADLGCRNKKSYDKEASPNSLL